MGCIVTSSSLLGHRLDKDLEEAKLSSDTADRSELFVVVESFDCVVGGDFEDEGCTG